LLTDSRRRTGLLAAALLMVMLMTLISAIGEHAAESCYAAEGARTPLRAIIFDLPQILVETFERHPLLFVYGIGSNLPFVATIAMARHWPAIVTAFAALAAQPAALVYFAKEGAIFTCSFGGALDAAGIAIFQLIVVLPLGLLQLAFVAIDRYWRLRKQAS
jgi:hypothetical protein